MTLRTSPEVGGMGHSIKRKEDPRFIRGKGTYVDDVVLPGMLYLDIVRSPHAHAKIVKIDAAKAMAVPGVLAVITGQDLAKYNLHWMPTLMSDTQMVLPVESIFATHGTVRQIPVSAVRIILSPATIRLVPSPPPHLGSASAELEIGNSTFHSRFPRSSSFAMTGTEG